MSEPRTMRASFLDQAQACSALGSPFTAALLTRAADWLDGGTAIAMRLRHWPELGAGDAVPLRFTGAVHALALSGRAPALADAYDRLKDREDPDFNQLWPIMAKAIGANTEFVDRFLDTPPQTNEVGRAAVLMAAAHELAARAPLPFHLLECGASAGLNLVFDQYRYRLGEVNAGPGSAELHLVPDWSGPSPPPADIDVAGRSGCDAAPLDLQNEADRLRLRSYIWADQPPRLARLNAAIDTARAAGVAIERAAIGNWLEEALAPRRTGCLTVLFHTIVWQYLPAYEAALAEARIREAGARATKEAPLARLAMEWNPATSSAQISLTTWPGGETRQLGFAHAHGDWIEWKGWREA
ncbi:hypothetical protein MNBD_ALPHA09-1942 [hydrothermal vent metagenome]|uniref:DUF2332 domain-containing protein n=1 Tax=hydrothermal vent metagenome TaxID=652676 RepID=A0A3B0T173_9ZZZZ